MRWGPRKLTQVLQMPGRGMVDRKPTDQMMIDQTMVDRSCFVQKLVCQMVIDLNSMAVRKPILAPAHLVVQTQRPVRASTAVQMLRVDQSPKAC